MEASRDEVLRFMRAATEDAERILHGVRLAILALVFLRLVIVVGDDLLAGALKPWLRTSFLTMAAFGSFGLRAASRRGGDVDLRLIASTWMDTLLAVAILFPSAVWPTEGYLGLLRAPDVMIFPVVAAAGGLRMTYTAAASGAVSAFLGLAGLLALDNALNGPQLAYRWPESLLALTVMACAGLLAMGSVRFVEHLLVQTANRSAEATRVRERAGAYLAPEFARIVLDTPGQPSTRRVHAVILFSDLRSFATYSEGLAPDQLVSELNDYLTAVVAPIHACGGIVDKYIGDAVMAVFGLPEVSEEDHARAIRAAFGMRAALEAHNAARATRGLPPFRQGIGVHAGEVLAGPVGTAERLQFTVLGDAVNVAARLEGETKQLGTDILISAVVAERARAEGGAHPALSPGPGLRVRGREGVVETFVPS